jgi:hypothetical protein
MRKGMLSTGVGALALLWLLSGPGAGAGDKKEGEGPSSEKIMELRKKLGTPGPNHKLLEPLAGEFTCKVKLYLPGKPAVESEGTLSRKWILEGRFLLERYEGKVFDKPFTGIGWIGYDNQKKKFTVAWIDSMSTSITTSLGTYDAGTKTFTYTSEEDSPYFGGRVKARDVLRLVDADTQTMEMYRQPKDGKEFKSMDIVCKRKGKS